MTLAQSCEDGSYNWQDMQTIFESANCTSCHTGAEFNGGFSELSCDNYAAFIDGGSICGTEILTGTTLVDIIKFNDVPCDTNITIGNMNGLAQFPISEEELVAIQMWIDAGAKEFCDTITAISSYELEEIKVFPNPVIHSLRFITNQNQPTDLKIYRSSGKLIRIESDYSYDQPLDVSHLPKGIYFIQIDGVQKVAKFIKL